jgi:hypothetical protein
LSSLEVILTGLADPNVKAHLLSGFCLDRMVSSAANDSSLIGDQSASIGSSSPHTPAVLPKIILEVQFVNVKKLIYHPWHSRMEATGESAYDF